MLVGVHQSHNTALHGVGAVHGMRSHLRGGEGAPGCGIWGTGEAGGWEHPWGADADPTMHPHPSLQQTFFFNVFEAPAELFDMPIFITVSAA